MDDIDLLKKFEEESSSTLEDIAELKNKFNYFEIIKKEESEIVHSNVLAWIFNPKSNHNLQAAFLTQFASKIGIRLKKKQIENTHVKREYSTERKRPDILITDYSTYFIVIENKIEASVTDFQLKNYYESLNKEFWYVPVSSRYFVFLTPKGDKPNHESWRIVDYNFIYKLLTNIFEKQSLNICNQSRDFLEQYTNVLGKDILKSKDEVKELCEKLYMKYKEALDLIYEYRMEKHKIIIKIINDIISKNTNLHSKETESKQIKFISKKLDKAFEKYTKDSRKGFRPIYLEFQIDYDHSEKLTLCLKSSLKDLKEEYKSNLVNEIKAIKDNNAKKDLFDKTENISVSGYDTLWKIDFLSENEYRNLTVDELRTKIEETMETFCEEILPDFEDFFENIFETQNKN